MRTFILILIFFCPATSMAENSLAVERECKRISNKLASVGYRECLDQQLTISNGVSVQQAPLLQREYLGVTEDKSRGRVLLVGGIHGDEYASVTIVFKWLAWLNTAAASRYHWLVVPLLNPDGLLQPVSGRANANGRDLQVAFPDKNQSINSTPETEWLAEVIESFRPGVIITIHAPHEIVDYPALNDSNYALQQIHVKTGDISAGSLNQFASDQGIPVLTVELPYADIMPNSNEVKRIWQDVLKWIAEQTGAPGGNRTPN